MTNTVETTDVAASTMPFVHDDATDRTVAQLKALAHPIRFQIVQLLADKRRFGLDDPACCAVDEVCVCRIKSTVDISAPTLSHHLKLLREAGLIEGRRDGVWIYYSIRAEALAEVTQSLADLLDLARTAEEQRSS